MEYSELKEICSNTIKANGFNQNKIVLMPMLIATEIAEMIEETEILLPKDVKKIVTNFLNDMKMLEAFRKVKEITDGSFVKDINHFKEELADIQIRLFTFTKEMEEIFGFNIEDEIIKKDNINKKRGYLHGKKN